MTPEDITAAEAALKIVTDIGRSEGTFMEFMASHEHTIRQCLALARRGLEHNDMVAKKAGGIFGAAGALPPHTEEG